MNMYSKYDEIRVIKQVMQNYADNQKKTIWINYYYVKRTI